MLQVMRDGKWVKVAERENVRPGEMFRAATRLEGATDGVYVALEQGSREASKTELHKLLDRFTFRNPYPAVDILVYVGTGMHDARLVLIERRDPPHGVAIPGGFVDYGESFETAAFREAKEELSLDVKLHSLFNVYSNPDRDPRQHTTSTVFVATAFGQTPVAADDAKAIRLLDVASTDFRDLPMAFDHRWILEDHLNYVRTGERPVSRARRA